MHGAPSIASGAPRAAGPADDASGPGSASALTIAGIAALLSSACCVLPLALVLLGVSGGWIGQLHGLEPWSPYLAALAMLALALAGWRIVRTSPDEAGRHCDTASGVHACRARGAVVRRWFWFVALLAGLPLAAPLVAPWFY